MSEAQLRMMVRVERIEHGYRLTTHALVARALLVGTLMAVAVSGECVSWFRSLQSALAHGSAARPGRDRVPPATEKR